MRRTLKTSGGTLESKVQSYVNSRTRGHFESEPLGLARRGLTRQVGREGGGGGGGGGGGLGGEGGGVHHASKKWGVTALTTDLDTKHY